MKRSERTSPTRRSPSWRIAVCGMGLAAAFGLSVPENNARASSTSETDISTTGQSVPGMAVFDRTIARFMRENDIPGAALAVERRGRLVYARGFGVADRENGVPVQPDSLFRIASLSKPITAVAVLKLVEDGRLKLDARVFRDLLSGIEPRSVADEKMNEITVRHLLRHSGGFDAKRSEDPHFRQRKISDAISRTTPLDCEDLISYMKRQWLDFSPGERYAYSNFGYCALGRVIEKVSGMPYEEYVREAILVPAGVKRMRVADPFLKGRLENEVRYYDYPGAPSVRSLDWRVGERVSRPYDGVLSTADSVGAWAASAVDLLRFVRAVDGRGGDDIIAAGTVEAMIVAPPYKEGPVWYGLGWRIRDKGRGRSNWWHNGSMPGTTSMLVRSARKSSFAVLMNSRPKDRRKFQRALGKAMSRAFGQVTEWPDHDLFRRFQ